MDEFHVDKDTKLKTDPLQRLTKLRREEVGKKEDVIQKEEILAAGQENPTKGAREVERQEKIKIDEKKKKEDDALNALEMKKRFYDSYKRNLAGSLQTLLQELDWIKGWTADVVCTKKGAINIKGRPFATQDGILLIVCTPNGRIWHQGITITQEPALDYAALLTMALQVENTMDDARGLLNNKPEEPKGIVNQYGRSISSPEPAVIS